MDELPRLLSHEILDSRNSTPEAREILFERALRKYGWHDDCTFEYGGVCNCGWEELAKALGL